MPDQTKNIVLLKTVELYLTLTKDHGIANTSLLAQLTVMVRVAQARLEYGFVGGAVEVETGSEANGR